MNWRLAYGLIDSKHQLWWSVLCQFCNSLLTSGIFRLSWKSIEIMIRLPLKQWVKKGLFIYLLFISVHYFEVKDVNSNKFVVLELVDWCLGIKIGRRSNRSCPGIGKQMDRFYLLCFLSPFSLSGVLSDRGEMESLVLWNVTFHIIITMHVEVFGVYIGKEYLCYLRDL